MKMQCTLCVCHTTVYPFLKYKGLDPDIFSLMVSCCSAVGPREKGNEQGGIRGQAFILPVWARRWDTPHQTSLFVLISSPPDSYIWELWPQCIQKGSPDQNFQMELPWPISIRKCCPLHSSSSAPPCFDSKRHEKGRKIDSKSWWQESLCATVRCHIMANKSHVFIVISAATVSGAL